MGQPDDNVLSPKLKFGTDVSRSSARCCQNSPTCPKVSAFVLDPRYSQVDLIIILRV